MAAKKKILGMTATQLGILGGLAGLVILLFCIVGWLLISRGRRGGPQAAPSTPIPLPSATLMLPATQTPTLAVTPIPYETLIPTGWVQFQSSLFEIWLPDGYKPDSADNLVTGLGNSPVVALTLRGTYTSKSPNNIYVTIAYEPMTGESLDQFLNERLKQLGSVVSDRSRVDLNTVPAVRLIFTGRKGNNTDINELTYVILDGTTVWYVQYTAELTEFYNSLTTFEASAKTFRMAKP